jgi:hypothetical protein
MLARMKGALMARCKEGFAAAVLSLISFITPGGWVGSSLFPPHHKVFWLLMLLIRIHTKSQHTPHRDNPGYLRELCHYGWEKCATTDCTQTVQLAWTCLAFIA